MGIFAALQPSSPSQTRYFTNRSTNCHLISSLTLIIFIFLCLERFTRLSTLASLVSAKFGSLLNALLNRALSGHRPGSVPSHHKPIGVIGFDHGSEATECAVCLCEIDKLGEEVTELKCHHKFHRVCLEQWMNHSNHTCPLCRGYLAPPVYEEIKTGHEELVEVVYFRSFCVISDQDAETDSWWLR